ncbi:MAG TPA: hypothetical protein VMT55_02540, partial [Candidatus Sulfotelmatobacter sp.]|nr:hypothetical protein [Candidatus Sulfotelmatobacter sp.]
GAVVRVFADGSKQPLKSATDSGKPAPDNLAWIPGTTPPRASNPALLELFDAGNTPQGPGPFKKAVVEADPQKYGVSGVTQLHDNYKDIIEQDPHDPDSLRFKQGVTRADVERIADGLGEFESYTAADSCQIVHLNAVDFYTLSDEEQIDLIVSDLLANLLSDMEQPMLYIQSMIPETITAPFREEMRDSVNDTLLKDIAQVKSWFFFKVTEKTDRFPQGRTLWIPYNMAKAGDFDRIWREFDTAAGVNLAPIPGRPSEYQATVQLNADIFSKRFVTRSSLVPTIGEFLTKYQAFVESISDNPNSFRFKAGVARDQVAAANNASLLKLFDDDANGGTAPVRNTAVEIEPESFGVQLEARPGLTWAILRKTGCIDPAGIRQPDFEKNFKKRAARYFSRARR